jgi:hypothetical protein
LARGGIVTASIPAAANTASKVAVDLACGVSDEKPNRLALVEITHRTGAVGTRMVGGHWDDLPIRELR